MRPVLLLILGSISSFAQPFAAGIKVGAPLTDSLSPGSLGVSYTLAPETRHYLVGGTLELRVTRGFAVEFDALYRRQDYTGAGNVILSPVYYNTATTAGNWEFPLLLKYRFHFPVVRPYVDAGAAGDTLAGLKQTITETVPGFVTGSGVTTTNSPPELYQKATAGFVLGAGVDIHAIFLHISPEVRYTRWAAAQFNYGTFHSNQNQAEFPMGLTF